MADPIIKKNSAKFDTAHNIQTEADIANKTADVYNLVTGEKYAASDAITVESKSITENGTYTAPAGKAYSPVTVNVEGDFTTAEMTLINSAANTYYILGVFGCNEQLGLYYDNVRVEETAIIVRVPLFKGKCTIPFDMLNGDDESPLTVTGGISIAEDYSSITITGDGTFTCGGMS